MQHARVINTGALYPCNQWQTPLVDDDVTLATEFAAICWVWTGVLARGDGTLAESILAHSHSIWWLLQQSMQHRVNQSFC